MLVMVVGDRDCVLSVADVLETMRPLPIEPCAGVPACVLGVSIVRGEPVPVLDVAALLGGPGGERGRFVVVRVGERRVALVVDAVRGVRKLDQASVHALPPLLAGASAAAEAIGVSDARLLVVLNALQLVPPEVFERVLDAGGAA